MKVGTPKEVKNNENRVGLIPSGVKALVDHGNTVYIETNAGLGSGIEDREYTEAGAILCGTAAEVYAQSDMIVKVKEPLPQEYELMKEEQILFTYLHLAPEPELTKVLLEKKIIGIAFETVTLPNGSLPLLMPMSMVAGRMSVQIGAHFLEKNYGGRGMLLGGVPGVKPAKVTIIGGGMVGTNAAKIAVGMGADVAIVEM
ncbi:MAG TPA: alanine dehydrogenase, partial [Peptococcaceae bacterium]|nr:alanine dehydrogenase [Peptococcaceae bacterium]